MADIASECVSKVSDAEVREHLGEIAVSPQFAHAPQLRSFLEFLVESVLGGREDEIKEANLGRDVFRRGPSYDPRSDAIVRVQASILRKRLSSYYENEGRSAAIHISLPKGGYVPSFERVPEEERQEPSAEALPARQGERPSGIVPAPAVPVTEQPSRRGILMMAGAFLAGAGATAATQWLRERDTAASAALPPPTFDAQTASPRIWGTLLNSGRPTQLAFGCPQFFTGGGLWVRDVDINTLSDDRAATQIRELTEKLQVYLSPAPHTYTGVGEMTGIHRVTQFLTYRGIDAPLSNVQLLSRESLEGKNLILVSSHRFRTLLDLLDLPKRIESTFTQGGGFAIKDSSGNIEAEYRPRNSGGVQATYGVISFWKHPYSDGWILTLSGIESWATYGVAEYVTSEPHLRELETALGDSFTPEHRGLQVLVQIDGRSEQALHCHYFTHRVM